MLYCNVKMVALLLTPILFGASFLMCCAGAQENYNQLPDDYKKGVDLALQELNSHAGVKHHFLFVRSLAKSDIESGFRVKYLYHNFYLKPTKCAKGTAEVDSQKCPFRNDRPLMNCAVCYKTFADQIENEPKPYVDCVLKPKLTAEIKASRVDRCNKMSYSSGSATTLTLKARE